MGVRWNKKAQEAITKVVAEVLLVRFALAAETAAKRELWWGHGVKTGTLRRSIHLAAPGYPWDSDDVPPGEGTPERGRRLVKPQIRDGGKRIVVELGSGLRYALPVEKGHHSFQGYHYLERGLLKAARDDLPEIVQKVGLKWRRR